MGRFMAGVPRACAASFLVLRGYSSFAPHQAASLLRPLTEVHSRLVEALIASVSFLVFAALDCLDRVLCTVFRVLDSLLDPHHTPCYCNSPRSSTSSGPNGAPLHAQAPVKLRRSSVTLHGRKHIRVLRPWDSSKRNDSCHSAIKQYSLVDSNAVSKRGYGSGLSIPIATISHGSGLSVPISTNKSDGFQNHKNGQNPGSGNAAVISKLWTRSHLYTSYDNKFSCGSMAASRKSLLQFKGWQEKREKPAKMVSAWSDCGCSSCTSWHSNGNNLHVHVEGAVDNAHDCVIFIHGFLSSSSLWTEEVIPYLPEHTKKSVNLYAVDLLGFGMSPKPRQSLYTMAEQLEMIETSVLQRYKVKSFHLVAHSMGCIVALGLAAAHAHAVKTITLIAPPYFPAPTYESAAAFVLRQVAPRRVWPPISFGASIMSWYEHIGRVICFTVCKNHTIWEPVLKLLTFNRFRLSLYCAVYKDEVFKLHNGERSLTCSKFSPCLSRISSSSIRDFMQHTHHSAWHIFHNVICGEADALDGYLAALEKTNCEIHVFHGKRDTLVPINCSLELQKKYRKIHVNILDHVNHFTIIFGRDKLLSHTLANIWGKASNSV